MDTGKQCWAHYLHRCFDTETVKAGEGIEQESLQKLQWFVNQKLDVTDADQDRLSNSTSQEHELAAASHGEIHY